jgi:hypothetical protein
MVRILGYTTMSVSLSVALSAAPCLSTILLAGVSEAKQPGAAFTITSGEAGYTPGKNVRTKIDSDTFEY